MSRWIWACALSAGVLASLLGLTPQAWAADDPSATAAARERFKEGVTFFDQKQYEKARAAFLQAYALKKHPAVLLNLAQSELRSGHERDAAEHFTQFLREATDASGQEREAAEAGLETAKAKVGEIKVTVDQTGAEVLLNGTVIGLAPLSDPLFVEPGSHTVEARKGELSRTATLTAAAGEEKEVELALGSAPPPAATPKPVDAADEEAEDSESEDEDSVGREPFLRWVTTRPTGLVPAGLTVLFGLGAGGFAVGSTIRYSDADDIAASINEEAQKDQISTRGICNDPAARVAMSPNWPDDQKPRRVAQYEAACDEHTRFVDQGDTFKTMAIGLGVGAGLSAVATVVLYFATAPRSQSSEARSEQPSVGLVPWVTPSDGGLSLIGRF